MLQPGPEAPSSSSKYSSIPFSRFPPPAPAVFHGNLTKRSLLTSRYIAIYFARYKAIEYVCQYRGIEPSNPARKSIMTVILPANMVPADGTGLYRHDTPTLTTIAPPLISRTRDPSSFSRRADFSCNSCACYSFVDRRSPSKKHRRQGCSGVEIMLARFYDRVESRSYSTSKSSSSKERSN